MVQLNSSVTVDIGSVRVRTAPDTGALPSKYNTVEQYPFMRGPVNQGLCGACWAISTTQVLADRANLWRHRHNRPVDVPDLSFQLVIDCAANCITYKGRQGCARACNGGFLVTGFKFLKERGTARYDFHPNRYGITDGMDHVGVTHAPASDHCPRVPADETMYRCDRFYVVNLYDTFGITNARDNNVGMGPEQLRKNAVNIQREIHGRGPVAVCFNMYSDFKEFWRARQQRDLVYELNWQMRAQDRALADPVGKTSWTDRRPGPGGITFKTGHSVSIVGWGEQRDGVTGELVFYWICRNSWGVPVNGDGYFKCRRGVNTAAIESDVAACWFNKSATLTPSGGLGIVAPEPWRPYYNNRCVAVMMLIIIAMVVIYVIYKSTRPHGLDHGLF